MKVFIVAAGLAAAALGAPASPPLDVKLQIVDNSNIKAVITNNGPNDITVVTTGSILGPAPVPKVKVFSGGSYQYLTLSCQLDSLTRLNRPGARIRWCICPY